MNNTKLLRTIVQNQKPGFNQTKLAEKICQVMPVKFISVTRVRQTINKIVAANQKVHKSTTNKNVVLAIGDLHAPFDLDEYFSFVQGLKKKYQPGRIVFIGDLIDNHGMCFHDINVDGYSAGDELLLARERLARYYKEFPTADVVLGNHDNIPFRKATRHGISQHVMKNPQEIWQSPDGWTWSEELWIDDVGYHHGTGRGRAYKLAQSTNTSTVHGHWHSDAGVVYYQKRRSRVFGVQVGCGVDNDKYAFEYGKSFKDKPVISAALIFDGVEAMVVPMK
jgi:hypothetical protein